MTMMMLPMIRNNNNSDHSEEVTLKNGCRNDTKTVCYIVVVVVVAVVIIVANKCSQLYSYCLWLTWIMSTELDDYFIVYSLSPSLSPWLLLIAATAHYVEFAHHVNITHWLLFVIKLRTNKFGLKFINTAFPLVVPVLAKFVYSPVLSAK